MKTLRIALLAASTAALPLHATAPTPRSASDEGANYAQNSWFGGSNAGTGFTPWVLGGTGHLIDTSLTLGGGSDLGTCFTYAGEANGFANRSFTAGPLANGQSFSIRMAVNFREGYKGVSVKSGDTDLVKLTVSDDNYELNDQPIAGREGATGDWTYAANTVFALVVTRQGSDLAVTITRSGGKSASYATSLPGRGAVVDGFSLYSYTRSNLPQNGIAFNDLAVTR